MKQKFSTHWIASKQPRKQRKYVANAPLHIKHKLVSANLSKDARKKYSRRSFPLRKGDLVKIMRGQFRGKSGKVEEVSLKRSKIAIAGIRRAKKDGTKISVFFNPSNLQIQDLNLDDKKRIQALERVKKQPEEKKEVKEKQFKKLPTETKKNA